jgi:hypothetical protein
MKVLVDAPLVPKLEQMSATAAAANDAEKMNSNESSSNEKTQSNQGSSSSSSSNFGGKGPIGKNDDINLRFTIYFLEVKLLQTTGDRVRNWIGVLGSVLLLGVVVIWFWGSDEKKSLNLPVANAHTEAINVTERFDDVKGIDEVRSQLEVCY